jgi:hypothetical protein
MKKIITGLFVFTICFLFTHTSFAMSQKRSKQNHSNLIELGAKAYIIGYKIERKVLNQESGGEVSTNTMTNRCSIAVKKFGDPSSLLFLEAKCLQGAEAQAMTSMAAQEAIKLAS